MYATDVVGAVEIGERAFGFNRDHRADAQNAFVNVLARQLIRGPKRT